MGQVYAINDIKTSSLMNLAVFLASPLLFIVSSIGAILGTLAGNFLALESVKKSAKICEITFKKNSHFFCKMFLNIAASKKESLVQLP